MRKNVCIKFIMLVVCGFIFLPAHAQEKQTSKGKEFWVAFGGNGSYLSYEVNLELRFISILPCTITLHFSEDSTSEVIQMGANEMITYALTESQKEAVYNVYLGSNGVDYGYNSDKSLHITSTEDILVYALNQGRASTEAATVYPVNMYGREYYHLSYASQRDGYLIIASEDNTELFRKGASQPFTTLSKGEVYFYFNNKDTQIYAGLDFKASRPVAYFTVTPGTRIGSAGDMDNLFEQLVPVEEWGKTFFVPVTRAGYELVRIVASEDNTTVTVQTYSGTTSYTLQAGEYQEFSVTQTGRGAYITADHPIAVASFMIGGRCTENLLNAGVNNSDPSMAWISPVEQMMEEELIMAAFVPQILVNSTNLAYHCALIVTEATNRTLTQVKTGAGGNWQSISGTWTINGQYAYINIMLDPDEYYTFSNPSGMLVWGYGYGQAESYYYQTGCMFERINVNEGALYVNGISHEIIDGKELVACEDIPLKAVIYGEVDPSSDYLTWVIDGVEETSGVNTPEWEKNLSKGLHTIEIIITFSSGKQETLSCQVNVTDNTLRWNPSATDNN